MRGLLRIVNTMLWCWIALSNALAPVTTDGSFWVEKAKQLFQLDPIDDTPRLLGRAAVSIFLWLFLDWIIRGHGIANDDGSERHQSADR